MTGYVALQNGVMVPASFAEAALGQPEMREVATTMDGRDITRGFVSPFELLVPQDEVLRARGSGNYQIYREVLRDWQVASTFGQRRLAVVSKPWEVEPGGKTAKDKAAADFFKEQLHAVRWDGVTDRMLFGTFYGFAVAEMLWGRDGRFVTIDAIKVRDRRRFGYDGAMQLRLQTMGQPQPGELLPEHKFWHFCTGADHDDEPYGLGLAHWLYWPTFFKRSNIKFWLIFLEKFGQPTAKGTYPASATPAEKAKLLSALGAITTDAGVILPEGMAIELIEAARSGTADYTGLCDRMDAAISKVVLGHTGSSDATPGRLGGEDNAKDVRQDLVKSDADLVCESFNRGPLRWLTEWNFPGAKPPRVWRQVEEGEDLKDRAEVDKTLHEMGYEPASIDYINDTYGGTWVKKQREARGERREAGNARGAAFAEPGGAVTDRVAAATEDQELLARAAEELGANWEKTIGPRVEQLVAFAESTGDLVTFRERLTELMKAPPTDALVESLTRAGFTAQLLGRTAGNDSTG